MPDDGAGVRARRHRPDSRRRGATRCPSARCPWTAPIPRDDALREAEHRRPGAGLGIRSLHPVRPVRHRLSAQRDSIEVLRREPARGRAGGLQGRADQRARLSRLALHAAGLRRGLHRVRRLRGELPGAQSGRRRREGDQHEGPAPASRRRPREHRLLRDAALGRSHAREFRQRARRAVPRAAVRVLGRVRGLRRNAVPQAPVAALRRPAAIANATGCSSIYGANLPTTPWAANAEAAARPGRTRSSRTTPSSASAIASRSTASAGRRDALAEKLAPRIGGDLVRGDSAGAAADRVGLPRAAGSASPR